MPKLTEPEIAPLDDDHIELEGIIANGVRAKGGNRTYEIITTDRRFRISIPEDWKVTFGPLAIAAKGAGYGQANPIALRVYESDTKQRGVFINVISFRDMSMTTKVAAVRQKGEAAWQADTPTVYRANLRGVKESDLERAWVDEEMLTTEAQVDDVYDATVFGAHSRAYGIKP